MTRNEVIQIARTVAEKEGWPWQEPLLIEEARRFVLFGRRHWRVTTNIHYTAIGRNVCVEVDDESGEVLSSKYVPEPGLHHELRSEVSAERREISKNIAALSAAAPNFTRAKESLL